MESSEEFPAATTATAGNAKKSIAPHQLAAKKSILPNQTGPKKSILPSQGQGQSHGESKQINFQDPGPDQDQVDQNQGQVQSQVQEHKKSISPAQLSEDHHNEQKEAQKKSLLLGDLEYSAKMSMIPLDPNQLMRQSVISTNQDHQIRRRKTKKSLAERQNELRKQSHFAESPSQVEIEGGEEGDGDDMANLSQKVINQLSVAPDGKREEFRSYLVETQIMDALSRFFVGLYDQIEKEKPENILEYFLKKLETVVPVKAQVDNLRVEVGLLRKRFAELEQSNQILRERLQIYEPKFLNEETTGEVEEEGESVDEFGSAAASAAGADILN